jgi:hypothetical protein
MLSNSKIALTLALLVATASGAVAASKHAFRHYSAMAQSPVAWQMPTTHLSLGSTTGSRRVANPTFMDNQDIVPIKQYPGD